MFSETELQLVTECSFILTKNTIIRKVYEQFGYLGNMLFEILKPLQTVNPAVYGTIPKISKGENYQGMPWVMLDYPRFFNKHEGHCAMRTFFWWGHYYLAQVQVSKGFKQNIIEKLYENPALFKHFDDPVWIGVPDDPYEYQIPQKGMEPFSVSIIPKFENKGEILKVAIPVSIEKGQHLAVVLPLLASLFIDSN